MLYFSKWSLRFCMVKALAVSAKFFKTWVGSFLFEYHFSGNNYMLSQPSACNLSSLTYINIFF